MPGPPPILGLFAETLGVFAPELIRRAARIPFWRAREPGRVIPGIYRPPCRCRKSATRQTPKKREKQFDPSCVSLASPCGHASGVLSRPAFRLFSNHLKKHLRRRLSARKSRSAQQPETAALEARRELRCWLASFGGEPPFAHSQKPLEGIPNKAEQGNHESHHDGEKHADGRHPRPRPDIRQDRRRGKQQTRKRKKTTALDEPMTFIETILRLVFRQSTFLF